MTTPHDSAAAGDPAELQAIDETSLTEAEERALVWVLVDAVGQDPVATPPEVVDRLDDVLAGLVAERAGSSPAAAPTAAPTGATVVPLADRRGPRRLPRLLLAAAAVVVGGYAVSQLPSSGSGGAGSADSASGSATASGASPSTGASGAHPDRGDVGTTGGGLSGTSRMSVAPQVRRDHLAADVRRVVRMVPPSPLVEKAQDPGPSGDPSTGGAVEGTRDCPVPRLSEGQRLYEVTYQGAPAGLVVSPPRKGFLEVTVYSCKDGGAELHRVVPAP